MLNNKQITEIEEWAQLKLSECDAGHDWWHIKRVQNNARLIHQQEGGDWNIILLAVILHDLADTKFFDEIEALMLIEDKLNDYQITESSIQHILAIIQNISFSKQWNNNPFHSLELEIVQDADRLDAIGAIGVARAFSYGGHKKRDFYNPAIAPQQFDDTEEYRKSNSPTINHFYEKLLLLKDKMNTSTGKTLADDRHQFMELYLKQFFKEWGEDL
ncbi:HD domain-containing protein [Carboxylicivirga sediminis]|uniref:HD domain-containing protein n=1 Tax=Carboxylicivirga sediminis TaxID=2006564 RepID=A0A941F3D5_9BACT|nr:HD domain-containing protein [Carboxylicivirga sediminis]MBR8535045.1 HD domain-containing protein [Carboxylicivirga sediminis]